MGKLKLHNLARLPLFSPSPFFSPSSPSLILQMLCLHQYKGLRSSLSLSLLQDTAAVSAGSGVHIDLPLGTHINEIWSFFFFPSLGADKRFTPPKIQRDAAAILESTLNIWTCLFVQFFPFSSLCFPRTTMKTFGKRWTPSRPHFTGRAGLVSWLTEESGGRNSSSLLSNPSQLQRSSNMCTMSSPKNHERFYVQFTEALCTVRVQILREHVCL